MMRALALGLLTALAACGTPKQIVIPTTHANDPLTGFTWCLSFGCSDMMKGALTFRHPEYYLFFTKTPNGRRAARAFLKRLHERTNDRDKPVSIPAFFRQLKAIHAWGVQAPADLSRIRHPVLVANGDDDRMVPTTNSVGTITIPLSAEPPKNFQRSCKKANSFTG